MLKWMALAALVLLAGCSQPDAAPQSEDSPVADVPHMVKVEVKDGLFAPADGKAWMSQGIHFTNAGSQAHTVTIVDPAGSQVLDANLEPGKSYHFVPASPGHYSVHCRLHDGMTAAFDVV